MPTQSSVLLCATCLTQQWFFYFPPEPLFCFLLWCVPLDIVQTVDYRAVWSFVYISICIQYVSVCVCGCSGDYFHTNTNRYLFLFCMIDTKAGASQLFNVWSSGMFAQHRRFTQAVFPMSHALWMCHKKCILYKFYRIHVFITRHALTQWEWQCTLLHKGTIETSGVWPFIKFFFFIDSITIKEII